MSNVTKMSTIKNVGLNVKQLRLVLGLTQDEFAEALGMTQGTLSRIEDGQLELDLQAFHALAKMNMQINTLFMPHQLFKRVHYTEIQP